MCGGGGGGGGGGEGGRFVVAASRKYTGPFLATSIVGTIMTILYWIPTVEVAL